MEHVRKMDIELLIQQLYRVLRPGGLMSHKIDLKDHLGGGLNNLRFPDWFWENEWVANSGFYTNRISVSNWEYLFNECGFKTVKLEKILWESLPIEKSKIEPSYRKNNDQDLLCSGFYCLLKK